MNNSNVMDLNLQKRVPKIEILQFFVEMYPIRVVTLQGVPICKTSKNKQLRRVIAKNQFKNLLTQVKGYPETLSSAEASQVFEICKQTNDILVLKTIEEVLQNNIIRLV